jgi:LmbE family N-acetylglucosaminyl deacetylase
MTDEARPADSAPSATPHDWRPGRFMVVVAHPDDADFGPAATAAAWIDRGSVGWLVCCTSGDAGGEDAALDPLVLSATREAEQRVAADVVGYAGVSFLHQPDGALANDLALRELLVREIRTFRPDAVLCNDPEMLFWEDGGVNHTDHRIAGLAAVDAVYPAARNPMAFPWLVREGLTLHKVRRLYLFWTEKANAWVDVSATVERKVEALRAHASQIEKPDELGAELRKWGAEAGARIGVAAAESFRAIVLDEDDAADAVAGSGDGASGAAAADPAGAAVRAGQA